MRHHHRVSEGRRMMATAQGSGDGTSGDQSEVKDLSYSDAGAELDAIIEEFETGVVDVDRLVEQLERATDIVDELDRRLRRTRIQVEELVPRLGGHRTARGRGGGHDLDDGVGQREDPASSPGLDQRLRATDARSVDLALAAVASRLRRSSRLSTLPEGLRGRAVDEVDRRRALVVGQALPAEGDDARPSADRRSIPGADHDGLHRLAPPVVGDADDRGVGHPPWASRTFSTSAG